MKISSTKHMTMYVALLIFIFIGVAYPRVLKDIEKGLQSGTNRVLLGVIVGDVSTIKQGIEEGGNVYTPLDHFIAEEIFKLGQPYVDYPICPPLHLAFNYGQKDHANVAAYLLRLGADVNAYQLPSHPKNYFERGYPPAMLYSLGLGQIPSNTHAAFLQRMYRSYGDRFNFSKIEEWRIQTDNPPLLHMSVALKAFDSVYVLLSEFPRIATIHTIDQFNMTALHYAAYLEDLRSVVMLLYNQANVTTQDAYGHTPLHLAVMRAEGGAVSLLLASTHHDNSTTLAKKRKKFLRLLHISNRDHRDALDMMCLSPLPMPMLHTVFYHAELLSLSPTSLARVGSSFQQACIERAMRFPSSRRPLDALLSEELRSGGQGLGGIDVLSAPYTAALAEYFYTHYFILHRPVLFEEGLFIGSPIWAFMDSIDAFSQHYGKLKVFAGFASRSDTFSGSVSRAGLGGRKLGLGRSRSKVGSLEEFIDMYGRYFFPSEVNNHDSVDFPSNTSVLLHDYLLSPSTQSCAVRMNDNRDEVVANASDYNSTSRDDFCSADSCTIDNNGDAGNNYIDTHGDSKSGGAFYVPLYSGQGESVYLQNFASPPLFQLCGDNDYGSKEFSFFLANSTAFHFFSSATNHLLLRGRLIWGVVPPSLQANNTVLSQLLKDFGINVTCLSDVPIHKSNYVFKYLYINRLVVLMEQREGEVLYLPPHYAAYIVSFASSILVSTEFCAHDIREQRVQPLGYAVYGGQDEYRGYGFERTHFVSKLEVDATLRPKKKAPVFQNPNIH